VKFPVRTMKQNNSEKITGIAPVVPASAKIPQESPCACCKKTFAADQLSPEPEGLLCPECLAEQISCGCSD